MDAPRNAHSALNCARRSEGTRTLITLTSGLACFCILQVYTVFGKDCKQKMQDGEK